MAPISPSTHASGMNDIDGATLTVRRAILARFPPGARARAVVGVAEGDGD
jgi:hypothetical protein